MKQEVSPIGMDSSSLEIVSLNSEWKIYVTTAVTTTIFFIYVPHIHMYIH